MTEPQAPVDETQRRRHAAAAMLPSLITIGNGVCGFVALTMIAGITVDEEGRIVHEANLHRAAWVILLGMVFDVFDGRVARMTGATSDLGAQLDSLCDLVTFGLAPAALMVKLYQTVMLHAGVVTVPWERMVWFLGLSYFLAAMLRLARFNVEHEPEEEAHACFQGMPTPAAAGAIASLVLVREWLLRWKDPELTFLAAETPSWAIACADRIAWYLPLITALLGFAMVYTRFIYPHVASQLLKRQSFHAFVTLIFAGLLTAVMPEPMLCLVFVGYMLFTPLSTMGRRLLKLGRST